jgi:signal transduction histidine kinase
LLLVFPDGSLPSRRWRWVPPLLVASGAAEQFYGAFETGRFWAPLDDLHHPWGPLPLLWDIPSLFAFLLVIGLSLACAWSLVLRYRRADLTRRRQIKWLALAGFGVPAYPLLCLLEIWAFGRSLWASGVVAVVSLVAIPLAAAVAVLRHDLYDVDKALAGAATWAGVTLVLLAVYASCSSVAGAVLGRGSALAASVATAACALALHPARQAVQLWVDRRLYPLRRAAFAAIEDLHRDISSGRACPEDLEDRLRLALRDPALQVAFPASDGDNSVRGVLVPGSGAAPAELLSAVAVRASTIMEMIRLRRQIVDALSEVESSRARLLQIGYEERRRLERDLHDGAQQRLVSLGMAMRLAQRHLDDGTVDVDQLLDQSVAELGTAVAELRQIAHGLRPSSLDDGLAAALANLVRSVPLVVDMEVDTGQLPDAVATTAYFVVSEALANAIKHANATRVVLRIGRRGDRVDIVVSDDGCGGARLRTGSAMADRVAALGGSLEVASPRGAGTVVRAEFPCAS